MHQALIEIDLLVGTAYGIVDRNTGAGTGAGRDAFTHFHLFDAVFAAFALEIAFVEVYLTITAADGFVQFQTSFGTLFGLGF